MKRHLQCAEQQKSSSNVTKYCACHEKWFPWLILVTHETSFTMRGATGVIVQPQQILCLPRKWFSWLILVTYKASFTMRGATGFTLQPHQIPRLPRKVTLIIGPCHIWNASCNARSSWCRCPTSPNTAPATKNYRPKCDRNLAKTAETSFTMPDRSETVPSMIREWSENETISPQPAAQPRLLFALTTSILYGKIQHFALRLSFQISRNTAPATKSDTSTSPNTAPSTKSDSCTSPDTAPATKSDTWTSPNTALATNPDTWTSPNTAPATKSDSSISWVFYYLTLLLPHSSFTWLYYYLTLLLLDSTTIWFFYYLTLLLLDSSITWLFY